VQSGKPKINVEALLVCTIARNVSGNRRLELTTSVMEHKPKSQFQKEGSVRTVTLQDTKTLNMCVNAIRRWFVSETSEGQNISESSAQITGFSKWQTYKQIAAWIYRYVLSPGVYKAITSTLPLRGYCYFVGRMLRHTRVWKAKSYPTIGLDRPLGFQEVEPLRISGPSAHESGNVVSPMHRPSLTPGDWVDPRAILRPENSQ
jgi:hypothetical protein